MRGVVGLGHAEYAAQIDEMGLRTGAFVQLMGRAARAPFADECLRLHHGTPMPNTLAAAKPAFSSRVGNRIGVQE